MNDSYLYSILFYWENQYIINCYGLLPVCIVGIVANITALIYLRKRTKHQPTIGMYFYALSICSAVQLLFTAHSSVPYLCDAYQNSTLCATYRLQLSPFVSRISATADTAHMWIIVALTVHRYWKFSHPFHSHVHDTYTKAKVILSLIIFLAVLFRLPMFFEVTFKRVGNLTVAASSEFGVNELYQIVYYSVLNTLIFNLVPFFILTVLNGLIVKTLWKARNTIRKDSSHRHREMRAAGAICIIVTLFLGFHSLFVYDVLKRFGYFVLARRQFVWQYDAFLGDIGTLLSAISSSVNPFIYMALGSSCRLCHRSMSNLLQKKKLCSVDAKNSCPIFLKNAINLRRPRRYRAPEVRRHRYSEDEDETDRCMVATTPNLVVDRNDSAANNDGNTITVCAEVVTSL